MKVKQIKDGVNFIAGGQYQKRGDVFEASEKTFSKYSDYLEAVNADGETAEDQTVDYDGMKKEDLAALAAERGLEVEGTGRDGDILKADYVKALSAE